MNHINNFFDNKFSKSDQGVHILDKEDQYVKNFGKQLSMHIAALNPLSLDHTGIDKEVLEKEMELISEELKNTGKPEEIAKKISLGKLNKFKDDNSLMSQDWVMEPKKKVRDILKEINDKDLKILELLRIKIGE